MAKDIGSKIESRLGHEDLIETLSTALSGSDLNTLLLEVFSRRAAAMTAPELLKLYGRNRFVHPAETDYLKLLATMTKTLESFSKFGFAPVQVSPLSQFGTCAVVATVDQKKVVSASRGTEVLSDATNALALHISHLKKHGTAEDRLKEYKFSATQRHVRAQAINIKGFAPHFTIGCLVSSGIDTGGFGFEKKSIAEHFGAHREVLQQVFGYTTVKFKLQWRAGYPDDFLDIILKYLKDNFSDLDVFIDPERNENNYYKGLQFKVIINVRGNDLEIADGGFVDWTQKLLNTRKERFCISGFGLELLNKFEEKLI